MEKFRLEFKNKVDKYIKLNGLNYNYFRRNAGFKNLNSVTDNGSISFKALFELSKFLNVDVRNFLTFDSFTYIFENSFENHEEFMVFLGKKLKQTRVDKKIPARELGKRIGGVRDSSIYCVEASTMNISLKRFYEFLNALEITPDEFFLKDEKYKITGNRIKNQISVEDFNNRIYELEKIKRRIVGGDIFSNPNKFPTLHGFLKICKSLRVSPKDFFDFDKKDFEENFKIIDIASSADFIKQKLESNGVKVQRYVELDSVFLFCNEKNIAIKDFFDISRDGGNINQTHSISQCWYEAV